MLTESGAAGRGARRSAAAPSAQVFIIRDDVAFVFDARTPVIPVSSQLTSGRSREFRRAGRRTSAALFHADTATGMLSVGDARSEVVRRAARRPAAPRSPCASTLVRDARSKAMQTTPFRMTEQDFRGGQFLDEDDRSRRASDVMTERRLVNRTTTQAQLLGARLLLLGGVLGRGCCGSCRSAACAG